MACPLNRKDPVRVPGGQAMGENAVWSAIFKAAPAMAAETQTIIGQIC